MSINYDCFNNSLYNFCTDKKILSVYTKTRIGYFYV